MREIEIKLRAKNLEEVVSILEKLGTTISSPKTQKDVNFVNKDDVKWFESTGEGWVYPRLRTLDDGSHIFTVKKPLSNEMDCIEHEVSVDDDKELRGMMELFGYIEGVTVKKTRRTCSYKEYTITLDQVEGLGDFVEIEQVVDDGDAIKIQDEMFEFAKTILGLEKDTTVMKGYDILMHNSFNK